jgi:L-rhamnose-H+ transport protein
MNSTLVAGLGLVLLAGLLQSIFAIPYKLVMRTWRWENAWLIYSVAAMGVFPWILVAMTVPNFAGVLQQASWKTIAAVAVFGFGWGVGSTFCGLALKRVGVALAAAIVLGITASFGSLLPLAVLKPADLLARPGYTLMVGLLLVIVGIALCTVAGRRREGEQSSAAEFGGKSFWSGLVICILSGIFSPMLNFSFVFGRELQQLTLAAGATPVMASNLIWAIALSAGLIANAGYCIYLLQKNHTWGLMVEKQFGAAYWGGALLMGFLWLAGIVAYGMGAAGLGALGAVVGWPVFMAMAIILNNLIGAMMNEWKGSSRSTFLYSLAGIVVLIVAIYVISRASVA